MSFLAARSATRLVRVANPPGGGYRVSMTRAKD